MGRGVIPMSGPKIGFQVEAPVREAEEAGASWGAPAEPKPQHGELELVTVTPRTERRKVTTHANVYAAAEQILLETLEEAVDFELIAMTDLWTAVKAESIKQLKNGLFYEVKFENEYGWLERRVFRADKARYCKKRTHIYFGNIIIPVEMEILDVAKTIYYAIKVDREKIIEMGNELESLLKKEGVL